MNSSALAEREGSDAESLVVPAELDIDRQADEGTSQEYLEFEKQRTRVENETIKLISHLKQSVIRVIDLFVRGFDTRHHKRSV